MPPLADAGGAHPHASNRMTYDIEARARTSDRDAVLALLLNRIGALTRIDDLSDELGIRTYACEGIIVVFQSLEDGFVSVWVRGPCPWPSSAALGRFLAAQLDCLVWCEPGEEYPEIPMYSSVFLEIEGGVERLFTPE